MRAAVNSEIFDNKPIFFFLCLFQVDNLEEMLKDKNGQIETLKARVRTLHDDHSSNDTNVASLEESLSEREKQIERWDLLKVLTIFLFCLFLCYLFFCASA